MPYLNIKIWVDHLMKKKIIAIIMIIITCAATKIVNFF